HDRYLTGAIDPDVRFRDFQNHVIHVNEGYWGGAPRVAHRWYDRLQRYLLEGRFGDAAHAAGVLSHYFTDVMQPLHTETCARERILHQPLECSVAESYDAIYRGWRDDEMRIVFQLSHRSQWLGEAMLHGARFAHRKRKRLLDRYAIDQAGVSPRRGLDGNSMAALSELFGLAITGLARVWERAAAEAESSAGKPLPKVSLLAASVLAGIDIPLKWSLRAVARRRRRERVRLLIDEFRRTGTLKECLPAEVDVTHRVVEVYHDELRWKQQRRERLESTLTVVEVETAAAAAKGKNADAVGKLRSGLGRGELSDQDLLVQAPSIGPKTSARFAAINIHTVGEFLSMSPEVIAERLQTYWITANTIQQWQAQAVLMRDVPGLKASQAQLLAGSGYRSAKELAAVDPVKLHRDVVRFASTTSGRRCLRGQRPPSQRDVAAWIEAAGDDDLVRLTA
ncbi:MAG: DUF4332 domain-containing protein, partial [Pirellulales bacterium]|nr:DUF4332 domain-containing protein [Pirellulales bacterium]